MSLILTSLSAGGAAGAVRAVEPLERSAQAPSVGAGAAVAPLREPDASTDEAWARIDLLLHQMRQLTLGGADSAATASATTTTGAISAYSEHANGDKDA